MVYGDGVAALEVSVDAPGVSVDRVVRVENPNYLFVYLKLDGSARPGSVDLSFESNRGSWRHAFPLRQKNPDPAHAQGFDNSDAIYLVTPDRFVNGEPGNDDLPGYSDAADRGAPCGRHGGDIAGLINSLDYINDMGFTAIWLNPLLENAQPECSYHGYATTDFYRVDPRYGSNEHYRTLVQQARSKGIGVIMDMIVNHVGHHHWWMGDLPTEDWLNFRTEPKVTNHRHAAQQDPYVSQFDLEHFTDGWFVVPGMPDLNQRNTLLADYLTQNALWWIEYLGLSGIRMDTYPYPDKHYMTQWTERVMDEYPDFNVVGEEWNPYPQVVAYWQRGAMNRDGYTSQLPSLMDFPLQDKMVRALIAEPPDWGSSWDPLYETLALDGAYADPFKLVIFPDNHDMNRIFTGVNEDYDLWRMAMVYVLTMRGTPQIYYGTEILMHNRGADGDHGVIRSDFPGGWAGDAVNAFSAQGLEPRQRDAQVFLRQLLSWRKGQPVIHGGALMQFVPVDEVYAYFRYTDTAAVMVAFNKHPDAVELELSRFSERLGPADTAFDVISGERIALGDTLRIPGRGVRLLEIR
jgi:glycosidase